jgi:hypothetical protein
MDFFQCGWSVCMCETRQLVSPFIKFCMSLFVGLALGFVGQTHPNEFFAPLSGLKDPLLIAAAVPCY